MQTKLFIVVLVACSLKVSKLCAQTTKWYFGDKAGLTFNSNGTTFANKGNTAMNTEKGCTAVTDMNGNLLFYTDGRHIWNGSTNVEVTTPSTLLLGSSSSTQAALAVPITGAACFKFLLFTTPGVDNPGYDKGLGVDLITVTGTTVAKSTSQQVMPGQTGFAEKLASTQDDANGYWLVAHDFAKHPATVANTFYAYHITSSLSAVTTTAEALALLIPVTSSVGLNHNSANAAAPQAWDAQGQMKFSPDGTKLALALSGSKKVEVFKFNKITGAITFLQTISVGSTSTIYGLEFSPNGELLYTADSYGNPAFNKSIYQINYITSVITTLSTSIIKNSLRGYHGMQLGPNGKIYISGPDFNRPTLSIINKPDLAGISCKYASNAVKIGISAGGAGAIAGLPTVICLSSSCFNTRIPCK